MSSAASAAQELHGRALGCKDGCGEVVRLDPLAEVVAEIAGVAVVEGEMAEGLQHDTAGLPHFQPSPIRDEDDPIAHVGDAAAERACARPAQW